MNTEIKQEDISAFHTTHSDYNSITSQFQMSLMVRQRGFNAADTNTYASVNGSGSSEWLSIQYNDNGRISSTGI